MARPKKDGMDYFPHDTNATNDKKIEILRMLYGNDGYAFYFILLEQIYQEPNFELNVSDAETIQILTRKIAITEEKFKQILETSLKRGCFNRERYEQDGVLTSDGVKKRASVVVEKREKMRDYYKNKQPDSEGVSDAETPPEIPLETPQSKVKKSKEKKSKVNKTFYAELVSMEPHEYEKLISQFGQPGTMRMIQVLDNYKGSSGRKYVSDYRTILGWVQEKVRKENPELFNKASPAPMQRDSFLETYFPKAGGQ